MCQEVFFLLLCSCLCLCFVPERNEKAGAGLDQNTPKRNQVSRETYECTDPCSNAMAKVVGGRMWDSEKGA